MNRWPIRLRVALAVGSTMALALLVLGVFVYLRLADSLEDQTRRTLDSQLDTLAGLRPGLQERAARDSTGDVVVQVLNSEGRILAQSPQLDGRLLTPREVEQVGTSTAYDELPVRLAGDDEQETTTVAVRRDDDRVLLVGQSREGTDEAMEALLTQLLVGGPLALLLAGAAGYVAAAAALRPIEQMRRRAADIGEDPLGERLPLPDVDDEISRLGETLNEMLGRLEEGLLRERRFVAEAGHELRTPLALLRTELELARSRPRSPDELAEALGSAEEEVDRLSRLAEDLLLTTTDPSNLDLVRSDVEVGAVLRRTAERFAASGRSGGRVLEVTGDLPVAARADPERLERALVNLVDNALKHGTGTIRMSAHRVDAGVELSVSDEGLVPATDTTSEVGATAAPAPAPSTGLGLAIVRALVEAHGATLELESDAYGTRASFTLPAADDQ